jgi:photosystem II stability/assembly factor-like uncharacterized protein
MPLILPRDRSYELIISCFRRQSVLALLILFQSLTFCLQGQMRQVYVDNVQADNQIKKISFYSPSEGYVAFTKWIGHTTDSGRTFEKKYITFSNVNYNGYSVNLTFGFGIRGVKALGADTLFVYGNYGFAPAILYSTDQGNSYTLVYQSQVNAQHFTEGIMDMAFPQNTNIGFAVEADRIIKTTNRGKTWFIVLASANSFFDYIEPVNDNTVFTFSTEYGNKLVRTDNGGTNWQQMTGMPSGQVTYAHFITPAKGWMHVNNGGTGILYYSSNGGVNWVLKNDPVATPFYTTKMKFVNDSTGYALGGIFYTLKTTDSGRTWEPLTRDNTYEYLGFGHNDIHIWNKDQLWAGGGHGFLELTTNGGGKTLPRAYFKIETTGTSLVNLKNYSKPGYQYKWYVNNVLVSTSYNSSYNHAIVSGLDSVKLVVTRDGLSDSITQYQSFYVPPLPTMTWVTPMGGSQGTMVTIYGSNFENITGVQFGGANAASFTIVNATTIYAYVGNGATGNVTLNHAYGDFNWPGFTYFPPPSSSPPVITSFLPASGPIGTVVTITGNNFGVSPASNIVYFGDTRATVNAAGAGQLTCTVPIGASYKPITVLNTTTGLSTQSLKPFAATFADSATNFTSNSFAEAFTKNYGSYKSVKFATSADVDNDGKTDIVAGLSYGGSDSLMIYQNTTSNGDFSFKDRNISYLSGGSSALIRLCDLDGDGLVDVMSAANAVQVPVFRNTSTPGNISFASPMPVVMNPGMQDVVASDFDGDGRPDMAGTNYSSIRFISVARNTSSPGYISFAKTINFPYTMGVTLAAGDVDNDGKNDIVVLASSGTITVFKNNSTPGNISFLPGVDVFTYKLQLSGTLILADMDGDGKLDIVSGQNNKIGRNTSTSGSLSFDFSYKASSTVGYGGAVVENLSGDSRPDFAGGYNGGYGFDTYLNTSVPGTFTMAGPSSYYSKEIASSTHAADFNNDGKPDVVITSWQSNDGAKLTVYKNRIGMIIDFPVCAGRANVPADAAGTTYQWQQDIGSGFVDLTDNANFSGTKSGQLGLANVPGMAWNGYKFRCVVDGSNYSSTYRLFNKVFTAPDVRLTSSATTVCYKAGITFTASDANGRQAVNYYWLYNQWMDRTSTPAWTTTTEYWPGTVNVKVVAEYVDDCNNYTRDTSDVITVTVVTGGAAASVSITTPGSTVCSGAPITFTATPVNGGDNPTYQWNVNGINAGTNSPVFTTSSLADKSQVSVQMTSSLSCVQPLSATSNGVNINVLSSTTPAVAISASATSICTGTNVLFSATTTNGGSTLQYQWKKNGQNIGTNSDKYNDNALVNGDVIIAELTSNSICVPNQVVTSNAVAMRVNASLTPSISITGNNTINKGQATNLQAAIANAGTAVVYQWQDSTQAHAWNNISAANSAAIAYSPIATGDKIRCLLTSNEPCVNMSSVMSNAITFMVNIPTAINPVELASGIRLYPNPVTSALIVDSLRLSDTWTTLEISNMSGGVMVTQIISNQTRVEVSVEKLSKGMYVAILRRKNGEAFYYKFVKM